MSDAAGGSDRASAIAAHVERYIGPIRQVLGDPDADPPVNVLRIEPTEERRYHTLITSGMSERAMNVPSGSTGPRYLELMCTLPKTWNLTIAANTEADWPVHELRRLARLPHETNSWLAWGHTVPHGEPPRSFASDTKLCGVIIVPSLMVPRQFYELPLDDRTVTFYSIVPLYKEELALKSEIGMERLLERLIDRDVDDLVQPRRSNVARRKLFGLLG